MAVRAYILMKVSSSNVREVCKEIADFDEVIEVSMVYGEYDIIAKVALEELEMLEPFVTEKIRNMPSVILPFTMIVAREYKGKSTRNALNAKKDSHG